MGMKNLLFVLGLIFVIPSCEEADESDFLDSECGQTTIVDNNLYKNGQSGSFSIRNISVVGDCLEVEIQSIGCASESWELNLVDSGGVAESNPEQRFLKLFLDNEELCTAVIGKTFSFDLKPLRTGNDVVLLNLEMWDEQIRYEY